MNVLFLDTSLNINFGFLDDKFNWISPVEEIQGQNASQLHYKIYESLEKKNLAIDSFNTVITSAGPGSYTGMRVSEIFNKVFSFSKLKSYTFYEYEIPAIINVKKGLFLSKAYKQQIFVHYWNLEEKNQEQALIDIQNSERLIKIISQFDHFYSNSNDQKIISEFNLTNHISKIISTIDLIKENTKTIFEHLTSRNLNQELFYYRPLDIEFTPSKT
ncbi:MAG: hypothetical protein U0T83_02345 [Bacteriovoracaceae bacterium]